MSQNKQKLTKLISQLDPALLEQAKVDGKLNPNRLFEVVLESLLAYQSQSSQGQPPRQESTTPYTGQTLAELQFDPLTQLPNRNSFAQAVNQAIKRAKRSHKPFALIFFDLDHFKAINDAHGHVIGDALLKQFAARISASIRQVDTLSRFAGDEFCLLVEDLEHSESIITVIDSIREQLNKPYKLDALTLSVTTSIGVSVYPDDGGSFKELLHFADLAMYEAKRSGRNAVSIYTPEISEQIKRLSSHHRLLTDALDNEGFEYWYQPELVLDTGDICAARQLATLPHPGLESEQAVYATAERCKHTTQLNVQQINHACATLQSWRKQFSNLPRIVVPLFRSLLNSNQMVSLVMAALDKYRLSGDLLEFEISETDLNRSGNPLHNIQQLVDAGCRFSLINLGIGPSALQLISSGLIYRIKIDTTLVGSIDRDNQSETMMRSIIDLGKKFSIDTVALDVGSLNQVKLLEKIDCNGIRGDFLSPPLSKIDYEAVLFNYNKQKNQDGAFWKESDQPTANLIPPMAN